MRFAAAVVTTILLIAPMISGQVRSFPRLPVDQLEVTSPAERVSGTPGIMALRPRACRDVSIDLARRRIVDIAVQEWAFFGFPMAAANTFDDDPNNREPNYPEPNAGDADPPPDRGGPGRGFGGRRSRIPPEEAMRVAATIGGYWSVTPEGGWIVDRQNDAWNGPRGAGARWENPWSAAFISWVACEAGLGSTAQFQRAVAHHAYVDQAIRARDGAAPQAAYVAYDPGDAAVEPGDLLCTSRRPSYRSLSERRRQAGVGARMHCDIVVQVEDALARLLVIGGNVRGVVAMKVFPAVRSASGHLRPVNQSTTQGVRPFFAHLKLRGPSTALRALETTSTFKAIACAAGYMAPAHLSASSVPLPRSSTC